MEPLTSRRKIAHALAPPPVIDPADRISRLPEGIQAQILSFLPAQDAVRTCILARTWRDVWKSTTRLLIRANSVQQVRHQFVDRLLRVRLDRLKDASLDASEIKFDPSQELEDCEGCYLDREDMSRINRWIRRVLKCQIRRLQININPCACNEGYLQMSSVPLLVSRHLTWLELIGVEFLCRCINLDGCPVLEHLEMSGCDLWGVRKIMSLSLKCLVITSCDSNGYKKRIQICVPSLVSLCLDNRFSPAGQNVRTPLLQRMPELVGAKVCIGSYLDRCDCDDAVACYHFTRDGDTSDTDSDGDDNKEDSDDDEERPADNAAQNTTKCVILEGLAQARDLVLIANHPTYILRRDLRWCPTFSKLKTLVLFEEYSREPADCSVLECMLEHAPLLEKLKLTIKKVPRWDGKFNVEIKGYPDAKMTSTKISQHLQIVEINCEAVKGLFENVLNLLGTLNICFETRVTKL